jgi:hypothetical protein
VAAYRIICTVQEPVTAPVSHQHIVRVGTGNETGWSNMWSVDQVLGAMNQGDTFYTQGKTSGKVASVERFVCTRCRRTYIRTTADAVPDNNLDNLPRCQE